MLVVMDSVVESSSEFDICAEIAVLPAGALHIDLVVTLSTINGPKAGLQWWYYSSSEYYCIRFDTIQILMSIN